MVDMFHRSIIIFTMEKSINTIAGQVFLISLLQLTNKVTLYHWGPGSVAAWKAVGSGLLAMQRSSERNSLEATQ